MGKAVRIWGGLAEAERRKALLEKLGMGGEKQGDDG